MTRKKRRFVDAHPSERCRAVIVLKDNSTADCGRRAVQDGLCRQHYKMSPRWERPAPKRARL